MSGPNGSHLGLCRKGVAMNRGRFSPEKKREIVLAALRNEEEIAPVVEQVPY
jgi:transposase-like protein